MIQFNLLPDVKMEYIKAKALKRTIVVISLLVSASALAVFVLLFMTVRVFQTMHMKNLDKDIKETTAKIKQTPDLNKVLTIQNQLKTLTGLHDKKPVVSRQFNFITQLVPAAATVGKVDTDFTAKTISISGEADALSTINKFVDTLKFTTYSYKDSGGQSKSGKPFSGVVMSSFGVGDKSTTYQISLNYDEAIFDNSKDITLTIPKIISTRSETEKPTDLFKALPAPTKTP